MTGQINFSQPCLAIDTSTSYLSIALYKNEQVMLFHQDVSTKQSDFIIPEIHRLLTQAHIAIHELSCIIYSQGPGTFTGLRIGLGVAKGLSTPFNIPLIGIPSLDAVAAIAQTKQQYILAAIDARMHEIFYAWYDTQNRHRISPYLVNKPNEIIYPEEFSLDHAYGIGNAFILPDMDLKFNSESSMPTAVDYLQLAQKNNYPILTNVEAELLYVRNKIALTSQEQLLVKKLHNA